MTMCSGQYLEEQVQRFCKECNQDEASIWQVINRIHTKDYNRNILWEKQKEEKENNTGDIPMSEQFAKANMVSNAIYILEGLENCVMNGWEFE